MRGVRSKGVGVVGAARAVAARAEMMVKDFMVDFGGDCVLEVQLVGLVDFLYILCLLQALMSVPIRTTLEAY